MKRELPVVDGPPPTTARRPPPPSRPRYREGHRTVGLDLTLEQYQALDARWTADGKTFAAIILRAPADQDIAVDHAEARGRTGAEAAGRKAAGVELEQLRRAHAAEIATLRQELAAADQEAGQRLQEAVARAEARRQAAMVDRLATIQQADLDREEARWAAWSEADRMRAEIDRAEQADRLARIRGDHDAELAAEWDRGFVAGFRRAKESVPADRS